MINDSEQFSWLAGREARLNAIEDSRLTAEGHYLLTGSVVLADEVIAELAVAHGLSEAEARGCLIVGQGLARQDTEFLKRETEFWGLLDD